VARADADTVRDATGFPIGGVSPVGHPPPLRVVIDRALDGFDLVWASAGTPHAVFPITFEELVEVSGGEPGDIRQR
jgi:prolyl-tRNA editing enzyme YbaK/EbsC (Cys-tRNA(Pro) deacylase)